MNPLNLIKQYWQKDLLPLLADLKFAIVLFLLIALASMTGTVIEQGQTVNFYQLNYPEDPALFGFLTWKVILTVGLDQVYKTWWFFSLLILFGSSLTACSFTRQIPSLKAAQSWIFYREPRQFEKLVLSTSIPTLSAEQWRSLPAYLQQRGYRCFLDVPPPQAQISDHEHLIKPAAQENTVSENAVSEAISENGQPTTQVLYARKGIIGRIGPIIVHISLLILIAGTIVGSLTGFFAQEMIPSGETFQVKHIFEAGRWAAPQVPKDWSVRVNRFWIDYTPEGRIDQFYSDLSVVDSQGQELRHKVIHVNEPLRYQGVTFYQADWAIGAIRVSFNNSPILQLPLAQIEVPGGRIWGTWLPTAPDLSQGVSLVAKDLQGTVMLYDNQGQPLGTLRVGMTQEVNGVNLTLHELVGSTGLQIKADPGVPIVYLGFGLLMISVLMSYVSHSQIWLLQTPQRLYVGGRTNRAQVAFERELLNLFSDLATSDTVQANMVQANSGQVNSALNS